MVDNTAAAGGWLIVRESGMSIRCRIFGHSASQFWSPLNAESSAAYVRRCYRCGDIVSEAPQIPPSGKYATDASVSAVSRPPAELDHCSCHAPGGYPHEPDCTWWEQAIRA